MTDRQDRPELREKIKAILSKPFGEIATSSGVFNGYQLSHKIGYEFTDQILALVQATIEGEE